MRERVEAAGHSSRNGCEENETTNQYATRNGFRNFTEDIAAVSMQKLAAKIDKPTYVGFTVLEYSKLLMYRFHYDRVFETFARQARSFDSNRHRFAVIRDRNR